MEARGSEGHRGKKDLQRGRRQRSESQRSPRASELQKNTSQRPASYPPSRRPARLTQAAAAVQAAGKPTGAEAHVAPGCVGAAAPGAEAWRAETLVHICADMPGRSQDPPALAASPAWRGA